MTTLDRFTADVLAKQPTALRILHHVRTMSEPEIDAWLRMAERMVAGMPTGEAAAMLWRELGREPPAG